MNYLYYGDCLTIIDEFKLKKVDLIYLDPPFNSNRNYSAIYKDETGRPLPVQVEAFCDMWELDEQRQRAIENMPILLREQGIDDAVAEFWRIWMNALRYTNPKLLAYLSYMVERLVLMKGILKATGSLYLHCDPTCSHYLKVLLDGIFGHENFRSEITWRRINPTGRGSNRFANNADILLYYVKGKKFTFNPQFTPHDPDYIKRMYRHVDIKTGRRYQLGDLKGSGTRSGSSGKPWKGVDPTDTGSHWAIPNSVLPESVKEATAQEKLDLLEDLGRIYWPPKGKVPRYKRYLDEMQGTPVDTIWSDIKSISPTSAERLGYATQKPLALMERIISASTKAGDIVLDPFCGCATTLEAAHKLGRRWIGIDIAYHAINRVAKVRLEEKLRLVEGRDFEIKGVPLTVEGAQDLWNKDKYQFQKWAVERVEGFVSTKRTSDGGIDGRIYFSDDIETHSMAVEVKGGRNVSISHLRALRGVLDDDLALMAGLIVLHPLKDQQMRNFKRFMSSAGHLEVKGKAYPRMQVRSVADILEGKGFNTPSKIGRRQKLQLDMEFERQP